jgi:hypothetical protein
MFLKFVVVFLVCGAALFGCLRIESLIAPVGVLAIPFIGIIGGITWSIINPL